MRSEERARRARVVYGAAGALGLALGVYLLWSLRALIVPSVIGALSAYICRPLLSEARRWGVPHKAGVLVLVGAFLLAIGLVFTTVKSVLSDEHQMIALRVRGQYKTNERYAQARDRLPRWLVGEAEPFVEEFNRLLALDDRERRIFEEHVRVFGPADPALSRYAGYHQANLDTMKRLGKLQPVKKAAAGPAEPGAPGGQSFVGTALGIISIWLVMPFVFLFLLFDQGQLVKNLVEFVPNRYFEVSLMVVHRVDRALGAYLRGVTLECGLVGLTFAAGLWLCGIDPRIALALGAIAGAANAIPFLGPAIGLVAGAAYALVAEEISPVLPFITLDNLLVGVLLSVAVAQALDNAYFQPIVLGTAVDLHPLLVIFGVMGGSILFGIAGMLLAVPAIVIVKVVLETLFRELKAYRLI